MQHFATFGASLKKLREEKGITQQALGDRVGIHRVEVARLEANKHRPTWRTIQRLCIALGVSCEEFREDPELILKDNAQEEPNKPKPEAADVAEAEPGPKRKRKK